MGAAGSRITGAVDAIDDAVNEFYARLRPRRDSPNANGSDIESVWTIDMGSADRAWTQAVPVTQAGPQAAPVTQAGPVPLGGRSASNDPWVPGWGALSQAQAPPAPTPSASVYTGSVFVPRAE